MSAPVDWVPVLNSTSEVIPSGGLMRVTGQDSTTKALTVAKPDGTDAPILVNSFAVVPPNGTGMGTFDPRVIIAYDPADGVPAVAETWGASSGTWLAKKDAKGFLVLGGTGLNLVNAVRGGECLKLGGDYYAVNPLAELEMAPDSPRDLCVVGSRTLARASVAKIPANLGVMLYATGSLSACLTITQVTGYDSIGTGPVAANRSEGRLSFTTVMYDGDPFGGSPGPELGFPGPGGTVAIAQIHVIQVTADGATNLVALPSGDIIADTSGGGTFTNNCVTGDVSGGRFLGGIMYGSLTIPRYYEPVNYDRWAVIAVNYSPSLSAVADAGCAIHILPICGTMLATEPGACDPIGYGSGSSISPPPPPPPPPTPSTCCSLTTGSHSGTLVITDGPNAGTYGPYGWSNVGLGGGISMTVPSNGDEWDFGCNMYGIGFVLRDWAAGVNYSPKTESCGPPAVFTFDKTVFGGTADSTLTFT